MMLIPLNSIRFGCKGNGVTVWTNAFEEHNDYMTIAHISDDRVVKWRKEVDEATKEYVEHFAKTQNMTVSATQSDSVFKTIV
jgi:hypothetical protein